jgi:hypothetical protein
MDLGEILSWIVFGVCCFFLGRIAMMHSIIRAVTDEAEKENLVKGTDEPGVLKIEKINNIYYAYIGADFAGQASNFDDLFATMKADKRFGKFKLNGAEELTSEEQQSLTQALYKNYKLK